MEARTSLIDPSTVTAIIQRWYPQRMANLRPIIRGIIGGTLVPGQIIIWNNDRSRMYAVESEVMDLPANIQVIHSSINTLMGRYAAAWVAETPYVFVQDDDLVVRKQTIADIIEKAAILKQSIIGSWGMKIKPVNGAVYSAGVAVPWGAADVVLGRCWGCHRSALIPGFREIANTNIKPGRCDDIMFSMAAEGGYVVQSEKPGELPDGGVGLSVGVNEDQHKYERNDMAEWMLHTKKWMKADV